MSGMEIRFQGQRIGIKAQGDPAIAESVVELVSKKLEELESRLPKGSAATHVAILSLLELAEEYVQSKQRAQEHLGRLESKIEELTRCLADAGSGSA